MNRLQQGSAGLIVVMAAIGAATLARTGASAMPGAAASPAATSPLSPPSSASLGEMRSDALSIVLADDAALTTDDPLDRSIDALKKRIRSDGAAPASLDRLGWTFVQKARETGDHGYYLLAGRCATAMREAGDMSSQSDLLEGHVLQSLHRFDEAERVAARLVSRRGSPLDHGLYGDILLDQGRLDEAVSSYERMMRRRPDSRAYARVAEVRLLTGDLEGAREALRTASRAVSTRDREAFGWIWARLALVELQSGHDRDALTISASAVKIAPGSPVAQFVRGRVLLASASYDEAVAALELAAARTPLPDILRALADAYEGCGRGQDAARVMAKLEAAGEPEDPRAFGLWLAETGRDPERALALAQAEMGRRRDVYTFDALAMAEAASGRVADARVHMAEALRHGSEDPRLWYHAGIIAAMAGQSEEARTWFLRASSQSQILLPSLRRDLAKRLAAAESHQS